MPEASECGTSNRLNSHAFFVYIPKLLYFDRQAREVLCHKEIIMNIKSINVNSDEKRNKGIVSAQVDDLSQRQTEETIITESCKSLSETMEKGWHAEWNGGPIKTESTKNGEIKRVEFGFDKVRDRQ